MALVHGYMRQARPRLCPSASPQRPLKHFYSFFVCPRFVAATIKEHQSSHKKHNQTPQLRETHTAYIKIYSNTGCWRGAKTLFLTTCLLQKAHKNTKLPSKMLILLRCTRNLFYDTAAILIELISLLFGIERQPRGACDRTANIA